MICALLPDIGCPAIVLAGEFRVGARRFIDVAGVATDILQDFQQIISIFGIPTSLFDCLSPLSASSTFQVGLSSPTIVLIGIIGVFAVPHW